MDGNIEIWRWLATALLGVLGWLIGRKDTDKIPSSKDSWDISREAVLLRIKQLEDLTNFRSEHPEFHPLANHVNGVLGKFDNRLDGLESRVKEIENG